MGANSAKQQLENLTGGGETLNQGYDNGQGGGTVHANPPQPVTPEAAPAEPDLTPDQQKALSADKDYQEFTAQRDAAAKAEADAAAKAADLQKQITQAPDSATKAQLQVDYSKALQEQSVARSTKQAADINAQTEKKKVIRVVPKIVD